MVTQLGRPYCDCSMTFNAKKKKSRSQLVLLDLSAVFDTTDNNTLVKRTEHTFGIANTALQWLKSYLDNRSQFISVGGVQFKTVYNQFSILQGLYFGPCLFSLYVAPIAAVIRSHGVNHAQYANDTQLYILLTYDAELVTLSNCFEAVYNWFTANGLNPESKQIRSYGYRRRC